MTVQIAVGVYLVVHLVGVYLLRASGTWRVLFAPMLNLAPDKTPDPLRVAPRGWIENHSFWDLGSESDDEVHEPGDADQDFWSRRQRRVG